MLESPATDPGRSAEETIRAEIIAALNAAFRGFSFPGGRWSTGYGAEMAAEALLSGPLAPILQEAAQLRARLHEAEKGAEAMRKRASDVVRYRGQRARLALQGSCDGAVVNRAIRDACANMASEIDALTPAPEATQEAGDA